MSRNQPSPQAAVPSVDRVLRHHAVERLIDVYGRQAVTDALRAALDEVRGRLASDDQAASEDADESKIAARVADRLEEISRLPLRPVFNLTGTVLHTNLGRAVLPEVALRAVVESAGGAGNLEFDLQSGRRGDRDTHLEDIVRRLTGAEAATVVNNNAAAVLLVLNSLALRKEVPVSRGELIEIGGSFRMPDIMARAGCKLIEVGTTNRTHLKDFATAVGRRTALILKVHTSNFEIQGFTAAVPEPDLATLAHDNDIPLVVDLGSGTLVDLGPYGLPHEPTVAETLRHGADLVTFSGDKLLGGPQAGIIAGRADLVDRIRRNPMKRALRLDKMTIAALAAVFRLYLDPDRLVERLPTLRLLARSAADIEAMAKRLLPVVASALGDDVAVDLTTCESQVGSGALPLARVPSFGVRLRPPGGKRGAGARVKRLAAAFRALPIPVIGRIEDDALVLDLRCLENEAAFIGQLDALSGGRP